MLCHTVLHSLPALVKHFATPLLYTLPHLAIPGYTLCHTLYNFATPYTAHHPWWNTLPHLIIHFATSCDTACHHWWCSLPYLITHFAILSHFAKPSYIACHPSLHTLPHLIIHFAIPRYTLCHTLLHALQHLVICFANTLLHTLPHLIIHFAIPHYTLCHTLLYTLPYLITHFATPCYMLCKHLVIRFANTLLHTLLSSSRNIAIILSKWLKLTTDRLVSLWSDWTAGHYFTAINLNLWKMEEGAATRRAFWLSNQSISRSCGTHLITVTRQQKNGQLLQQIVKDLDMDSLLF